jgi:hypothetical protein
VSRHYLSPGDVREYALGQTQPLTPEQVLGSNGGRVFRAAIKTSCFSLCALHRSHGAHICHAAIIDAFSRRATTRQKLNFDECGVTTLPFEGSKKNVVALFAALVAPRSLNVLHVSHVSLVSMVSLG